MFELWDKAQVIVALTRTKIGKNVIIIGDMQETINAIISSIQTRIQWTDYMANILDLITVGENIEERVPILNYRSFPFRICDISLPQSKTGFVYFLISVRNLDYTYIGECSCITKRLYQHNSGHGSTSTASAHCRPFAVFGYICGFNGENKPLRRQVEKRWKEKRDFLINQGTNDPKIWFRSGRSVIDDLDDNVYMKIKAELRLVELFKD